MAEDLARATVSFFAIIDPIGNLLVFYLLTRKLGLRDRRWVAAAAVGAALAMLVVFAFGGREVLDFLDISAESFQVAAGVLLLPPAFRLVMHGQPLDEAGEEGVTPVELALVPMATPLLAGPGALAAAVSFSDRVGPGTTVLAAAIVLAFTFLLFAVSEWAFRFLRAPVLRLLARIVGILLFAIAADFILEGTKTFFDL